MAQHNYCAVTALRLMNFFADCMHVDCIDETDRFCFLCDINGMCSMLCMCMVYTEEHKVGMLIDS